MSILDPITPARARPMDTSRFGSHADTPGMTRTRNTQDYLILAAIMALALALRVWGLNAPLWFDEIMTLDTHIRLPWQDMMQTYSMNHHYLFSLQAKATAAIFGESPWSLRLPAMLFGLGSIAATWVLARDISGRTIAHVTALLLALSFHHIWFSQNARGYTELAFWSTLATILFLRGTQTPTLKIWLGFAATFGFAMSTHLTGLFFFLALGFTWLVIALRALPKEGLRAPIVLCPAMGFFAGGLLTLAFYAPILPSILAVAEGVSETSAVDVMQEYQNPVWTVIEAVRTAIGGAGPILGLFALVTLATICLGAIALGAKGAAFTAIVALHIGLTMALLTALGMRIWPRFFFVDIGFLMLLLVMGVHFAARLIARIVRILPAKSVFTIGVVAMTIISAGLAARNYTAPKQNFEAAVDHIGTLATATDRIYSVGVGSAVFNGFYKANWTELATSADFDTALTETGPAYFVIAFPARSLRTIPAIEPMIENGELETVVMFPGTLGDGTIAILKRP